MIRSLSSLSKALNEYVSLDPDPKLLIAAQSLVSITISIQNVVLAIYISKAGYGPVEVGLVLTVSTLVTMIMLLPGGMIADAVGRKKISSLGLILGTISLAGYLYPINIYYLIAIAAIGGLGSAFFGTTVTALLADSAPTPEKRNLVFSIAASLTTLAGIIGLLAGGMPSLLRAYGFGELESYYPAFIIASGSLAISSILMLMLRIGNPAPNIGSRALLKLPTRSSGVMIRSVIYTGMLFLGTGLIAPALFSLWLYKRFGVEEGFISILYVISQAIVGVSFLASPAIAKRIGSVGTIVITQGSATVTLVLMALIPNLFAVSVIFMIARILLNISSPIMRSFILGLVDPSERATASGVLSLTTGLSSAAMPTVTGYLMSNISLESPFYIASSIIMAAALAFYAMFKQYESRGNSYAGSQNPGQRPNTR